MYKKKIARLALCTALCALVTTSVFANAPLCNTTTATRTGNFSLVSNPH